MLKYDPKHFGHASTRPPYPNVTKKWASVRDLNDLYRTYGTQEGDVRIIDLGSAGYEKLLGGGSISEPYIVKIPASTKSADAKVKAAGGEVLTENGQ